jgi:hypothetical protein
MASALLTLVPDPAVYLLGREVHAAVEYKQPIFLLESAWLTGAQYDLVAAHLNLQSASRLQVQRFPDPLGYYQAPCFIHFHGVDHDARIPFAVPNW